MTIKYEIKLSDKLTDAAIQIAALALQNMCAVESEFNGIQIICSPTATAAQIVEACYRERCRRNIARSQCAKANELEKQADELRDIAEKEVALPARC